MNFPIVSLLFVQHTGAALGRLMLLRECNLLLAKENLPSTLLGLSPHTVQLSSRKYTHPKRLSTCAWFGD